MSLKTERFLYVARNNQTGLADVRANLERNGVSVATNVALAEVDAVNFPGVYELVLTPAQLATYGGSGFYSVKIDSVSKTAPATTARWVLNNDADDLAAQMVTVETKVDSLITSQSAQDLVLSNIQTKVTDTNSLSNSAVFGFSALKNLIDSLSSKISNIQNNTMFSADVNTTLVRPESGSKTYRIPIRIFDMDGNPEDPDTNEVLVSVKDESGNDRNNLLFGYVAGAVAAVRDGVGIYHIDVVIAGSTQLEQLIFEFAYSETNNAITITKNHTRTSEIVASVQASGLAQQATLQEVLDDTSVMQPQVEDIQLKVNNATYGLAALKTLLDSIDGVNDANNALLTNAGYGLSALASQIATKASQTSVDNIATSISTNVLGAGHNAATDSLKAISDRLFSGGYAI